MPSEAQRNPFTATRRDSTLTETVDIDFLGDAAQAQDLAAVLGRALIVEAGGFGNYLPYPNSTGMRSALAEAS